jgi:hypothetical protein
MATDGWMKTMLHANYRGKSWLWIGILALLSACRSNGAPEIPSTTVEATLLTQSSQCWNNSVDPSVVWITNSDSYESVYNQTRKHLLGDTITAPSVDFTRLSVVAVYMGRKPTAGYHVSMASRAAAVGEHNELILLVSWIEPPGDALLAQVITSPCILVSIPKGNYSTIQIVDESGRVRALRDFMDRTQ